MASLKKSRPALSLLVVDDDKPSREILQRMIPRKFPDVVINIAENGRQGVQLFKEHMTDIVITDINMPRMDGILMGEEIKSIKADTKFIVLTGYSDKVKLDRFSEIGIYHHILKPVDFKVLFAAIEKCMAEIDRERQPM